MENEFGSEEAEAIREYWERKLSAALAMRCPRPVKWVGSSMNPRLPAMASGSLYATGATTTKRCKSRGTHMASRSLNTKS